MTTTTKTTTTATTATLLKSGETHLVNAIQGVGKEVVNLTASVLLEMSSFSTVSKIAFKVIGGTLVAKVLLGGVESLLNVDLSGAQELLDTVVNLGCMVIGIEVAYKFIRGGNKASDARTQQLKNDLLVPTTEVKQFEDLLDLSALGL